jgi:hypothetical protein
MYSGHSQFVDSFIIPREVNKMTKDFMVLIIPFKDS